MGAIMTNRATVANNTLAAGHCKVYTVPGNTDAVLDKLFLNNQLSTTVKANVYLALAGNTSAMWNVASNVAVDNTATLSLGLTMNATDILFVRGAVEAVACVTEYRDDSGDLSR